MQLPAHPNGGVQIGISDIIQWRDCAARMVEGMKRHDVGDPPESWSPANAYGSAIHLCLEMLDNGATIYEAAQAAMAKFKQWLEPSDLSRLIEDMEKYLAREMTGVRTLLNEGEISFKLFVHPTAGQVWFRARIDRLYQSLDDDGHLIHLDFKSSKWAKSADEVAEDLQIWSYNLTIIRWFTDLYPEVDNVVLEQVYDQLMYGQIPTQKGDAQRTEIARWLIAAVTAIIEDEEMEPTFNEFCPWCHLAMDCPVVQTQLTDWATTRIAALMPREPKLKKDGTPSKVLGPPKLDPDGLRDYVEMLPKVKRAAAVLKVFNDTVTETLKEMPDSELHLLGRKKVDRNRRVFTTAAKRAIIEEMGLGRALMLFQVTIAEVQRFFGGDKEAAAAIEQLAEKERAYTVIEEL